MTRTLCLTLLAATTLAACSRSTPEQQTIDNAAQALGGRDRIQAVKTLVIEGTGTQGNLGQDVTPDATGQRFTVSAARIVIDVAGNRSRTELTRTPDFPFFAGQAAQRQVSGLDGEVAYNVAPNGTATRAATPVANNRRTEFFHHPLLAVRAALAEGATVSNARTENGQNLVDVRTSGGQSFTLATDATMNLPSKVTSLSDNTNLGDVTVETTFGGYQAVNGLQLPTRITQKTDIASTLDLTVTKQAVDADAGDLAAPAAAASAAPVAGAPPANVTAEELAPGVWFLGGQSHHSVLVEFNDHLTLIEAPQNDVRALAVIAKARELRPNKPLTQLVMSHHHFDHSGGVRAAISEGLTVITHKASAALIEDMAKRPHTIVPDALAKNPKPATVEAVDGERTLTDGTMTVNLYAIEGNPHADTFLVAYFPKERLLVEADMFTPGAQVTPYVPNLYENIRKRNLRVDRVVPLHGTIVPFTELVKAAGPAANATN
jgi:glyoxylase-like metal-dependent hydrolase (beta-lactamase superfamily II)